MVWRPGGVSLRQKPSLAEPVDNSLHHKEKLPRDACTGGVQEFENLRRIASERARKRVVEGKTAVVRNKDCGIFPIFRM